MAQILQISVWWNEMGRVGEEARKGNQVALGLDDDFPQLDRDMGSD